MIKTKYVNNVLNKVENDVKYQVWINVRGESYVWSQVSDQVWRLGLDVSYL